MVRAVQGVGERKADVVEAQCVLWSGGEVAVEFGAVS